MKKLLFVPALLTAALTAHAAGLEATDESQDEAAMPSVRVRTEARVDFNQVWQDSELDRSASGFKANSLALFLDGRFNDKFSYALKQRFDKAPRNSSFLDATPWVYITYTPIEKLDISAGKQVVAIGGYEYDRSPSDIFFASEFWNNISCYQLGVSAAYNFGRDKFTFQVTQSPFFTDLNSNMYSYNLEWRGQHGPWQTIWSANLAEWTRGRYISYLALGNRLDFNPVVLELDFMNRGAKGSTFFFRDCSVMADLGVQANRWLRPFAKYTYDVNHSNYADLTVLPGTEINTAGAGIEAWPLKKSNMQVLLHADACYSWGKNGNPAGAMTDKRWFLNLGVKWSMTLCDYKKKPAKKI